MESIYPAINPNPLSSPVVVGVLVVGSPTGELVGNVTVVGELTGDITVVGELTGDITVAVAAEYLKRDPIVFL
jgi:hypothetical protein